MSVINLNDAKPNDIFIDRKGFRHTYIGKSPKHEKHYFENENSLILNTYNTDGKHYCGPLGYSISLYDLIKQIKPVSLKRYIHISKNINTLNVFAHFSESEKPYPVDRNEELIEIVPFERNYIF